MIRKFGDTFWRWFLGNCLDITMALALGTLALGIWISISAAISLQDASASLVEALQFQKQLGKISLALQNAESSKRGYLIVGDGHYLTQFETDRENLREQLQRLQAMAAKYPQQQSNIARLQASVAQRLQIAAQIIAVFQQQGIAAARQLIATGAGAKAMQDADESSLAAEQWEEQLLNLRIQKTWGTALRLFVVIGLTAATVLGLLLELYWLIRQERAQRIVAAEMLRRNQEQFRLAVEASPDGMIMVDQQGQIELVNAATEKMFGYARSELIGQSVEMVVPAGLRDQHAGHRQEYVAHPALRQMGTGRELFAVRKDGSEFPVDIGLNPIRTADRLLVLSSIVDITQRKKAEEESQRFTRRLAQSNRELEAFAYISSHDLQEPLRKIQAFSDRLKADHSAELSDEARDYLDRMGSAANRMRELIKDLLAFSRVNSKAQPFVPVDLNAVLAEVLDDLEVAIQSSGGQITFGPLPTIEADRLQMKQLFQNLIGNALKFRRPETPPLVSIHAAEVANAFGETDGHWRFTIEDNGIGFDPKYADRIFGVFQRLHGRELYEGSGIGLSICRKIVERHDGAILAEGRPGQGATFIVTLAKHPASQLTDDSIVGETHPAAKPIPIFSHPESETVPCLHAAEASRY